MIASDLLGASLLLVAGLLATVFAVPRRDTTSSTHEGRIVGGSTTTIGVHPYQVALVDQSGVFCGGSIIAPNLILTAAHCTEAALRPENFKVRAGSTQHDSGGQLMAVIRFVPHENYSSSTVDYDIAIVILAANLVYSDRVQPVQLPTADEDLLQLRNGTPLLVSGWGLRSESAEVVPEQLHHAVVLLIAHRTCAASYSPVFTITERMLCAGHLSGGDDSCQGDSGGPLTRRVGDVTTLYGIVSFGVGCGLEGIPGVYARVAAFRSWIDGTIATLFA